MRYIEIINLLAIVFSPVVAAISAVQIEKYLERQREQKNRRLYIFKTLMATRGSVLSFDHVEALNRIDLEFSNDQKYKKVIDSWKEYFDNLGQKAETDEQITIWTAKNEELLANLLFEMGLSLGYNFDKVLIKRNIYSPVGHGRIEKENELIRKGILDVLNGETSIPMELVTDDKTLEGQRELQDLMIQYYKKRVETGVD